MKTRFQIISKPTEIKTIIIETRDAVFIISKFILNSHKNWWKNERPLLFPETIFFWNLNFQVNLKCICEQKCDNYLFNIQFAINILTFQVILGPTTWSFKKFGSLKTIRGALKFAHFLTNFQVFQNNFFEIIKMASGVWISFLSISVGFKMIWRLAFLQIPKKKNKKSYFPHMVYR